MSIIELIKELETCASASTREATVLLLKKDTRDAIIRRLREYIETRHMVLRLLKLLDEYEKAYL